MSNPLNLSVSKRFKLTLIRSVSGRHPKHQATLASLGLKRIGQSVSLPNNPATVGMIHQVNYLIQVEEE